MRKMKTSRNVMLLTIMLGLCAISACGNKGDLYQDADTGSAQVLEDAAEKLKKTKKPTSPAAR